MLARQWVIDHHKRMKTSFEFSHIIARQPGSSIASGLRDGEGPDPDVDSFLQQHQRYLEVMAIAGVEAIVLPPLEAYPDSVFVEDAALCIGDVAITLCPGAPSRKGEVAEIRPALDAGFSQVIELRQGEVDGGDVLVTEDEVMVGLSARTDTAGINGLREVVSGLGYTLREVKTPETILHFKTACGLLDDNTIFAMPELVATGCFDGYRVIEAVAGEEAAANLVRVNDVVLLAAGYPKTRNLLEQQGYSVLEVDISEAAKVDGGLSCMSLRYNQDYSPGAR